jgi:hypothetical protein
MYLQHRYQSRAFHLQRAELALQSADPSSANPFETRGGILRANKYGVLEECRPGTKASQHLQNFSVRGAMASSSSASSSSLASTSRHHHHHYQQIITVTLLFLLLLLLIRSVDTLS